VDVVNLSDLAILGDGATIDPDALKARGLVRRSRNVVKLLGDGEAPKNLTIKVHRVSAGARSKVEAAGGSVELLS
jgi:large subunit ribosomal protein L15